MPGTVLPFPSESKALCGVLTPVFSMTSGLYLSQVAEIMGIETAAIQNWVKREFVSRPKNKKYTKRQTARLVIINALRGCMQIDKIVLLLRYINGSLTDEGDDIIDDSELYDYFCNAIYLAKKQKSYDCDMIKMCVNEALAGYLPPFEKAKSRLENTLYIMALAYLSTWLKKQMENDLENILKGADING